MTGQIKSKERVKKFAEVFTAEREVKAMCDLIPQDIWNDITKTFLEPACGNGNFLVEIYKRKLYQCNSEQDCLKALTSIVGIDIQEDNVKESRERLKQLFIEAQPDANAFTLYLVDLILKNNIICGDSIKIMAEWEIEV
jgi:SAM-dependent methyltransferase